MSKKTNFVNYYSIANHPVRIEFISVFVASVTSFQTTTTTTKQKF